MNDRVIALREAFDASFASLPQPDLTSREDALVLRIGGHLHVVRISELASVQRVRAIVSIPSEASAFAGLVALRTGLVPVYDLGALLGYAHAHSRRWVMVLRGTEPLGLAVESLEKHARLPGGALDERQDASGVAVERAIDVDGARCALLSLSAIARSIADARGQAR